MAACQGDQLTVHAFTLKVESNEPARIQNSGFERMYDVVVSNGFLDVGVGSNFAGSLAHLIVPFIPPEFF